MEERNPHRFLKGLKSALLSRPELQPLQHHLFRYTKYRWSPTPRYISKYLWVGHHLPHVCVHLLSHLGVYLCWEFGRSLKVSMPPQWWIQEKTNVFHTTVHSPDSQGEKYPSFKQHDPGKLNMMWKRTDLLHLFCHVLMLWSLASQTREQERTVCVSGPVCEAFYVVLERPFCECDFHRKDKWARRCAPYDAVQRYCSVWAREPVCRYKSCVPYAERNSVILRFLGGW